MCWHWTGSLGRKGYGQIKINGKPLAAHRVAFELANGRSAAADAFICHTCDTPACCNPAHLYEGDAKSNAADMIARNRNPTYRKKQDFSLYASAGRNSIPENDAITSL